MVGIKRTGETGPVGTNGKLRFKFCREIIRNLFQVAGVKQHKCVIACLNEQACLRFGESNLVGEFFSFHGQLRSRCVEIRSARGS